MVGTEDEVVGRNLRLLREAAGMSQADMATAVTERGVPGWHPQTTTKVEGGVRSLKLVEAVAVADVLGVSPQYLYEAPPTAGHDQQVRRATSDVHVAISAVWSAEDALVAAVHTLRDLMESLDVSEAVRKAADAVLSNAGDELGERLTEAEQQAYEDAAVDSYLQLQADEKRGK